MPSLYMLNMPIFYYFFEFLEFWYVFFPIVTNSCLRSHHEYYIDWSLWCVVSACVMLYACYVPSTPYINDKMWFTVSSQLLLLFYVTLYYFIEWIPLYYPEIASFLIFWTYIWGAGFSFLMLLGDLWWLKHRRVIWQIESWGLRPRLRVPAHWGRRKKLDRPPPRRRSRRWRR